MDVMPEQFKQACWYDNVEESEPSESKDWIMDIKKISWSENFDLGLKETYEPDASCNSNQKFDLRCLYCDSAV